MDTVAPSTGVTVQRMGKMKVHEFTVIASGLDPVVDDVANSFYEAGCDDAVLSFQKGVFILEFEREAPSLVSAIISACEAVQRAGARVDRLEPDYLVSLADIARRSGLSRSAITNYHQASRGKSFPAPVARVTSESPLWDWYDVASWLHGRGQVGKDAVIEARIIREANIAIETHSIAPARLADQVKRRLSQLQEFAA